MRIVSILLMCLGILCTGCSDKEPPKKDTVKRAVPQEIVEDESVTKLEIETPIYTSLLEMSRDARHGKADKWKDKWIVFEGHVARKEVLEERLYLYRSSGDTCIIINNDSKSEFYEYQAGLTYIFSARVINILSSGNLSSTILKFEDQGKLIIPPDYTGIIDVDLNVLANDVKQGELERWIGKKVRFTGKVRFISQEEGELRIVNPDYDIFDIFGSFVSYSNFQFIISGFDPNSNEIGKYKDDGVYTFTVKIEGLDPLTSVLSMERKLIASIIDE